MGCKDDDGCIEEQTVERVGLHLKYKVNFFTCPKVTPDGRSEVVFTLLHGNNKQGCAVQPVPGGEVMLISREGMKTGGGRSRVQSF